mgnify:CR=1 FL=1
MCARCPPGGYCVRCAALLARVQGLPGAAMSEKQVQACVREVCKRMGYLHYHTWDSRKSEPGYPDSTIIHPDGGVLWMVEIKRQGETPTLPQQRWLEALSRVERVEAAVVYPDDLAAWVERLGRRR